MSHRVQRRDDTAVTPRRRIVRRSLPIAAAILALAAGAASAQPPTVNGLFYGDGDDARYVPWHTSYYGSQLYVYYNSPTTTLYVAMVVDPSVNDNVFTDRPPDSQAYMASVGWGSGGGQQRAADSLTNSEYGAFTFACNLTSGPSWSWQQAYGCAPTPSTDTWLSRADCGPGGGTPPPGIVSSSSFVRNVNNYRSLYGTSGPSGSPPWNMYVYGTDVGSWKSPFAAASPGVVPGDYSGFSTIHSWEWRMVYEWSIDLGSGGADCGNNDLFLIAGLSHHSPMKAGVEGDFDQECGEENDCFPPGGGGGGPLADWGDLPDTYGTLAASNGARHAITVDGPYLGLTVALEADGEPGITASAATDDDGIQLLHSAAWAPGSKQPLGVQVSNAPSGALLGVWFDWDDNGDFLDPDEFFSFPVVEGTNEIEITVGPEFDFATRALYARFRIFSSAAAAPGGSLDQGDYVGSAADGEVEDYHFSPNSLPVTLNAFASERSGGGELVVRWQTASETDNVGFEIWGVVGGEWRAVSELVESQGMNSALPQSYELTLALPTGPTALQLVDYDTRGRAERFGPFQVGSRYGEVQPVRTIDWREPRAEREARLRERGFTPHGGGRGEGAATGEEDRAADARWRRLGSEDAVSGRRARYHGAMSIEVGGSGTAPSVLVEPGGSTHVEVRENGIQRVTYETLRDGGLDLAGVESSDIAVTWRGAPVARWISDATFGPGSFLEFVGRSPAGDDALYIDAHLYQVSVDPSKALAAPTLGMGKAQNVSPSYLEETWVDRPLMHHSQSPTGDPWVEQTILVRPGSSRTVTLDLPIDGPVADGASRLLVGLGAITDLPDVRDGEGGLIPEHNVEVWFRGPGGSFSQVATSAAYGSGAWNVDAGLPAGALQPGLNQIQLRFSTAYMFSLVVIDRYGASYRSPYVGPTLDFAPDTGARGYRIDGFASGAVAAYAEGAGGSLTRVEPRVLPSGGGFSVELRKLDAARIWVTEAPHAPSVFTTAAPADLLGGSADLLVIAESSFIGTPALDAYLAQRSDLGPLVVDVEDIYNSVGFGMALPGAITDFLRARDAVDPYSHVQLVGADCYDRRNYVSSCISFVPLPTAPVGVTAFSPSQNRLVDLDGDGVGDKAIGQFSVRTEAELATVVAKGASWETSGLSASDSALLIAEESDGIHDFAAQIDRLATKLAWSGTEILDLGDHPDIATARAALNASLTAGRALTVFSGHSSPTVWARRSLLTPATAGALTNAGKPTLMLPLACETTYDVSPSANVLGHQLLFGGDRGAVAISGAVSLASMADNGQMASYILDGLEAGLTLGEAVLAGRQALGTRFQTLQDNWITQGDVAIRMQP
jgi:hypothetical protein